MPTYEYECISCKYKFEEWQNINEPPLTTCPKCNGKLKRLISGGAGFIFKGSGFYITDYRSKEYIEKQNKETGKTETKKEKVKTNEKEKKNKTKST
jgi:putative FmdB family regulatory protein